MPVTIKTRIGFSQDKMNVSEIAHAIEEAGASAIAVHGRYASMVHSGPADWDAIAMLKSAVKIPVIGNGGVKDAAQAVKLLTETGVDGVMIGRAAVGKPWLFNEGWRLINKREFVPPSPPERRDIIMSHLERLLILKAKEQQYRRRKSLPPDQAATLQFRAHLYKYLQGLPGWPSVRRNLQNVRTREDVEEAVKIAFTTHVGNPQAFFRP
jgi:tRNA-dihydrouridine synthase